MSRDPFDGRVVLITGAASGIGRALASELAGRGAVLALADIDEDLLERTVWSLGGETNDVYAFPLDVTRSGQWEHVVAEVYSKLGDIEYFFNNAGVAVAGLIRDTSVDDWQRMMDVNVMGVVRGVDAVYPRMRDQGRGHIINTASIAGLVPVSAMPAYSASKHAVVSLSESLRAEAGHYGVRVSVVCPGIIDTPMAHETELRGGRLEDLMRYMKEPPLPVSEAAAQILRGVEKRRGIIVITRNAHILWRIYRTSPAAVLRLNQRTAGLLRKLTAR